MRSCWMRVFCTETAWRWLAGDSHAFRTSKIQLLLPCGQDSSRESRRYSFCDGLRLRHCQQPPLKLANIFRWCDHPRLQPWDIRMSYILSPNLWCPAEYVRVAQEWGTFETFRRFPVSIDRHQLETTSWSVPKRDLWSIAVACSTQRCVWCKGLLYLEHIEVLKGNLAPESAV